MEDLKRSTQALSEQINDAYAKLQIEKRQSELSELNKRLNEPDYWQDTDNQVAQEESKHSAALEQEVQPWLLLKTEMAELEEFVAMGDASMQDDLASKLVNIQSAYDKLRGQLRFSGEHDSANVVLTIQAGAGGNDAQDWAQMLMRMYLKWAEKTGMQATILSEANSEEAGIKNASLSISGSYAFGKLKGEHGVHRLVRLSPFNSANSRETSFAMVEVIPETEALKDIEIEESDLRVDVYRAGGRGGQSVNTTDSAVRVTHLPTGIVVSIQNERSQIQNKETAMKVLKSRLAQLAEEQHQEKISDLKGPITEASWGNQIRSYVLHPYTMVKDSRSNFSTTDVNAVLDGNLDDLIDAYLQATLGD